MPETLTEVVTTSLGIAKQFMQGFNAVCKSMQTSPLCEVEEIEPEYVLISINGGEQYVQIDEQEVENENEPTTNK